MTLSTFAIVGGFRDFQHDRKNRDYRLVSTSLDYLNRSGVSIADRPTFDPINFEDNRDFLQEESTYDAIIIAHIPRGTNLPCTRMAFNRFCGKHSGSRQCLENTISPLHTHDAWANRVKNTGAKIVISYGTVLEIDQNYLKRSSSFDCYSSLISPQDNPDLVFQKGEDDFSHIYGEAVDIPMCWVGISMQNDFILQNIENWMLGNTLLARKALKRCTVTLEKATRSSLMGINI